VTAVFALAYLAVVVFRATRQGIAKVLAQNVGIQLMHCTEAVVADYRLQLAAVQEDLVMAVEVQVQNRVLTRRCLVEQRLEVDDRIPYRAAQVRQVDSAEQAVPVSVVCLGKVQKL